MKAAVKTAAVLDQSGARVSDCSLKRAWALVEKGAAIVVATDPMTITLTRVMGNGVSPASPRDANAPNESQKKRAARIRSLLARDGGDCFYCGLDLRDDVSLEHLLALADGGTWRLANLALAHRKCNELAADLAVVEKVRLRERLRASAGTLAKGDVGHAEAAR